MKFFQNTGLLSKRKAVRQLFIFLFFVLFAVFVWRLNQVQKTELVVRTGQTFEKAVVTAVLQDNLQADGSVRIPAVLQPYMGGMTEIK